MNARRRLASIASVTMSWPPMRMEPDVGAWMPTMHLSVLVLPAPFGPMRPITSPPGAENEKSSTALSGPYIFVRRSTTIMGTV